MTSRQFWDMVARNWAVGGCVFAICLVAALAASLASPPLYEATAFVQIAQPANLGSDIRAWDFSHGMLERVDADVLENLLRREDVLDAIIARAGVVGRTTASQLHRHLELISTGVDGLYETTVWSPSRTDAPRLANAAGTVAGDEAIALVRQNRAVIITRLHDAMAALRRAIDDPDRSADPQWVTGGTDYTAADSARERHHRNVATYALLTDRMTTLDAEYRANPLRETLVKPAGTPVDPVTPGPSLYLLFGAAGGAVLGLTAVLIAGSLRGPAGLR